MAQSRRTLLQGSVMAALGAVAASPAVAAVASPTSPDAELVRLCGEFIGLERQVRALDYGTLPDSEEEARFEAQRDALTDEQEPLVERICALPCTTLEGARALARVYASWVEPSELTDEPGDYIEDRLVGALVRGLIGAEGSPLTALRHSDAGALA